MLAMVFEGDTVEGGAIPKFAGVSHVLWQVSLATLFALYSPFWFGTLLCTNALFIVHNWLKNRSLN
jgi:hypothetical protein